MATTLITVGNARQPFTRLLDAVNRVVHLVPRPMIVQSGHTPFSSSGFEVRDFFPNEEFLRLLDGAALVICHAGAGTIIQAVRAGHVPVVMPRLARYDEHIDNHQLELVQALGHAGKIVPVLDSADLEEAVRRALEVSKQTVNATQPRLLALVARCLEEVSAARGRK
jgi:beta-1,4-N-acetylglucosaminyltransferase